MYIINNDVNSTLCHSQWIDSIHDNAINNHENPSVSKELSRKLANLYITPTPTQYICMSVEPG